MRWDRGKARPRPVTHRTLPLHLVVPNKDAGLPLPWTGAKPYAGDMPQHDSDTAGVRRVSVEDVARLLGLSENAIRKRVERGSLRSEKIEGTRYILLDGDMPRHDGSMPSDATLIAARLENEVEWLRREVERKDTIIMSLSQSIAALEVPPGPRGSDISATEGRGGDDAPPPEHEKRSSSWWRRLFGFPRDPA